MASPHGLLAILQHKPIGNLPPCCPDRERSLIDLRKVFSFFIFLHRDFACPRKKALQRRLRSNVGRQVHRECRLRIRRLARNHLCSPSESQPGERFALESPQAMSDLAAILARRRAAVDNQNESQYIDPIAQYNSPPAASRTSHASPHVASAAATQPPQSEIPPKVTLAATPTQFLKAPVPVISAEASSRVRPIRGSNNRCAGHP